MEQFDQIMLFTKIRIWIVDICLSAKAPNHLYAELYFRILFPNMFE